MKILDLIPITDRPQILDVQSDMVDVYRNQIIVWVSIGDVRRYFPALLDTGHSHNFSITERQLQRWSGVTPKKNGELVIDKERVSQYQATIYLHRSVRGNRKGDPYPLEMPQGISVFAESSQAAPRLPLLGLRSILSNQLKLVVDGKTREVSLSR